MSNASAERMPPQNLEAEQATIGCCLMESGALLRAREVLTGPDDFYRTAHQQIYRAICAVDDREEPVDVVTVANELRSAGLLSGVGGGEYLTRCIGEVPTTAHIIRYATILRECAVKREVICETARVQERAYADEGSARDLVTDALAGIERLGETLTSGMGAKPVRVTTPALKARVRDLMTRAPGIYGPRTGIGLVDALMGGMAGQNLMLVRALTKGLKSVWGMQTALTTARHYRDTDSERVVLCYLLEARETWEQRALAWLGEFDGRIFVPKPGRPAPAAHEIDLCGEALAEWEGLPLMITSDCNEIGEIELDVRQKAARHEVGLVLVDHLHRVVNRDHDQERMQLWFVARRLARLSDSIGCPVLLTAQAIRRQDGEWHTKESSAVDDEVTLLFEIQRGDEGMERHEWQKADWFRLYCKAARNEPPFDSIEVPPLYCDLRTGDLRMMDERQWIQRGHPTWEQQQARRQIDAQRSAGYAAG